MDIESIRMYCISKKAVTECMPFDDKTLVFKVADKIFALAALGLPGTSGFLGEFLVLAGAFQKSFLAAMLATFGVVLGAAYMLWLTKRVIFGVTNNSEIKKINDINKSEVVMLVTLAFFILFFGFYPLPLMETFNVSVNSLINNYETALITN